MKKTLTIMVSTLFLFTTLTGCTSKMQQAKDLPDEIDEKNPFLSDNQERGFLGSLGHGPIEQNLDENNTRKPFVYSGEEVTLKYAVNASGMAKNVGFLVFVNGEPQPYKVDDINAPYEYMYTFSLKEDHVDFPFEFIFSPVTGKKGEVLDLTILSIYNPDFIPDMNMTTSYGGYHTLLPATYQLEFMENAVAPASLPIEAMSVSKQSEEAITSKLTEELSLNGFRNIDAEILNKEILTLIYFNGVTQMDNLKISSEEDLHISYKLCGHPGLEYTTIFYANHKPIASTDGISYDTSITKGSVSVIELDIDTEKLDEFTTFYAVSVPKNAEDYPDEIFMPQKTLSILFYKGE